LPDQLRRQITEAKATCVNVSLFSTCAELQIHRYFTFSVIFTLLIGSMHTLQNPARVEIFVRCRLAPTGIWEILSVSALQTSNQVEPPCKIFRPRGRMCWT